MDDSLDTGVPHIARVYNYCSAAPTTSHPASDVATEQMTQSTRDYNQ